MTKTVISNINQFAILAAKNQAILSLPAFAVVRDVLNRPPAGKKACCNKGSNLSIYRPQFEAALAMLDDNQKVKLKQILNTDQICYFTRDKNGQINQLCF